MIFFSRDECLRKYSCSHKESIQTRIDYSEICGTDSSFVHTFSSKGELGSEGWNEHKQGYGFKLHLLIDCETKFPIALIITNGLAHDSMLAIPLLKKAKDG